jgi:hypothetical protein
MVAISTVKRLPREIREEIHRLLDTGQTLDAIVGHLRGLGVNEVSRSALGRYKKNFDAVVERVRRSREIADVLVRQFGHEDESKAMRANIEMMHGIVSDMLMQVGDGENEDGEGRPVLLEPKAAHDLAKALDHLARAKKTDQEAIIRIREEATKEATQKAAEAVVTVGKQEGMSGDLRQKILTAMGVKGA